MRTVWTAGLLLAFVSSGFVQKYLGTAGLLGYTLIVVASLLLAGRMRMPIVAFLHPRERVVITLFFAALSAVFLSLHHIEDGRGPGRSSDRDEGLEIAVHRLLEGQNPYYPQNEVAGPLSLLPGAILLSVPFVAIGSVGMQNVFWMGAFLWVATRHFGRAAPALTALAITLAISPSLLYEFVSGGDMIANGCYVACSLALAWGIWSRPDLPILSALGSALLLALALASRANFILLAPVFGAFLWRTAGFRRAIAAGLVVAVIYLAVVLPFYMADPQAFTPLMSRHKLTFAARAIPWADKAIIAATTLTSLGLGVRLLRRENPANAHFFFRCCTFVTLTPMVCAVLIASWVNGAPDFSFMHDRFGLMYLYIAILGWGAALSNTPTKDAPNRSHGNDYSTA